MRRTKQQLMAARDRLIANNEAMLLAWKVQNLIARQKPLEAEFQKVVEENIDKIYEA